jgi:hypothetical protein
LADYKGINEFTMPGVSRGLVSVDVYEQIRELTDIVTHARSKRPLYHVHADPSIDWSADQWQQYWTRFENEFGLQNQPFAEAIHIKSGREHRHRAYSLVNASGACLRLDHDFARREKINRLAEIQTGERLTPGRHNRAAIAALRHEGHAAAAEALEAAGLHTVARPSAPLTPPERHQQERTRVTKAAVQASAYAAWRTADNAHAFEAALADHGLRLAVGDSGPVVLDASGSTHGLRRILSAAARGAGQQVTAADVAARLANIYLPPVEEVRVAIQQNQGGHYERNENRIPGDAEAGLAYRTFKDTGGAGNARFTGFGPRKRLEGLGAAGIRGSVGGDEFRQIAPAVEFAGAGRRIGQITGNRRFAGENRREPSRNPGFDPTDRGQDLRAARDLRQIDTGRIRDLAERLGGSSGSGPRRPDAVTVASARAALAERRAAAALALLDTRKIRVLTEMLTPPKPTSPVLPAHPAALDLLANRRAILAFESINTSRLRRLTAALGQQQQTAREAIMSDSPNNFDDGPDPVLAEIQRRAKVDMAQQRPLSEPPRRAPRWSTRQGGYDALSENEQRAARDAHGRWLEKISRTQRGWKGQPIAGESRSVQDYVDYVQKKVAIELKVGTAVSPESSVAPSNRHTADRRRVEHCVGILSEQYPGQRQLPDGFVVDSLNRDGRFTVLSTPSGARLHDYGDRIMLDGPLTPAAAADMAALASANRWTKISLTGPADFCDAVATAMALRQPPIEHGHTLSKAAQQTLTAALADRARAHVPAPPDSAAIAQIAADEGPAAAALAQIESRRQTLEAALAGKPVGELDPAALATPRLAELRERRDSIVVDAREARALADQHKASHSLLSRIIPGSDRRRQSALDREARRLEREAKRLQKNFGGDTKRIVRESKKSAKQNLAGIEDWQYSPAVVRAWKQLEGLRLLEGAVQVGDGRSIVAAARGDWAAAAERVSALASAPRALDPQAQAFAVLMRAERAVESDPAALERARAATAAARAGDKATLAAAASGDPAAAQQAAMEWQRRQKIAQQQAAVQQRRQEAGVSVGMTMH